MRRAVQLALGLAVVLVPAAVVLRGGLYDDAWIHLRLARTLLATGRPEFNPGDPVLSTSSLPWTVALAALSAVGGANAAGLAALGAAVTSAAAGIWALVVAEAAPGRWAWGAAGLVVAALTFGPGAGGMEAPLAMVLLGGGALAWARGAWVAAGALLGAAVTVRLELGVFLGLFAVDAARARPAALLAAAAALAPPLVAELVWFGTVVPHPILAKRTVYDVRAVDALLLVARNLPGGRTGALGGLVGAGWAALGLAALAVRTDAPVARRLVLGALGVAGAYVGLHQYVHPWYIVNFAVPGAVGAAILVARSGQPVFGAAAGLAAAPAVLELIVRLGCAAAAPERDPQARRTGHVREGIAVGAWVAERLPGAVLATSEIGGLGWGFSGRVEDGMGLVTPGALLYHPMAVPEQRATGLIGAIPGAWVRALGPELVVGREHFTHDLDPDGDYVRLDPGRAAALGVPPTALELWVRRDVVDRLAPR